MLFLAQDPDGSWHPGIGDPGPLGWITVFAYAWAAYVCFRAYRLARIRSERVPTTLWGIFTAGTVFLGINKQLDLQSLLTVTARQMALRDGWYEQRHTLQVIFIAVGAVLGVIVLIALVWFARRHVSEFWLSSLGAGFLVIFILARASSFHHVDLFLHTGSVHMNWVLELGGIACIGTGARRSRRFRRRRRRRVQ